MVAGKKVPLRKCVATGEMLPKKSMIRVVRSKEGEVSVDLTGKRLVEVHMYQNQSKLLKSHAKK